MGKFLREGAHSYLNRVLTLKLVHLGTAEPGSSPTFFIEKKRSKNDAPQWIKGGILCRILRPFIFNPDVFLKEERPFFCGIARDYCL